MSIITIFGRLGANAELKTSQSGVKYLTFSVAENQRRKGEERTEWYRIRKVNGDNTKLAESLTKGKMVEVSGTLESEAYMDKNNKPAVSLTIWALQINFIGPKNETENLEQGNSDEKAKSIVANSAIPNSAPIAPAFDANMNEMEEDLPF